MKKLLVIISLLIVSCVAVAQDNGAVMKPNYRKIARVVKSHKSPYYLDSLEARFSRCDTTMTVDDLRCLYFGGGDVSLRDAWRRYQLLLGRFGRHGGRANDAWWQYQMLLTAVWSTGDGSEENPLYVKDYEDFLFVSEQENPGNTLAKLNTAPRCSRLCKTAHPMPDGSWRWYCYRK